MSSADHLLAIDFGLPVSGKIEVVFGDTVTARSVVTDMRESEKRPQFGIVTWRTEGRNQKGQTVVGYERANLIMKRSSA